MVGQRKRVLFLVPNFIGGGGGAERVMAILLHHLDHAKFECHLAKMQAGTGFLEQLPPEVLVHQLNVVRMRYALPSLIRLIRNIRPQTVLSTVAYLNVMLILAKPFLPHGIRVLLREATTPTAFVDNDVGHPRIWRWLYRYLYPRADKIICLSDAVLEDMAVHFAIARHKLVRIYNPVDTCNLQQSIEGRGNPYNGKGPHLVAIGRLRREKGLDLLLDALPAVRQRFPGVRLTILGEGPQESDLKEQVARLGLSRSVDFRGFEPSPAPFLRHADLFVLPSRFEGMPNALLEALALGTPVVACDSVEAMREIQAASEQLLLVPPENPAALAQGIISVLVQPKTERGSPECLIASLNRFDLQHAVDEYSRLF